MIYFSVVVIFTSLSEESLIPGKCVLPFQKHEMFTGNEILAELQLALDFTRTFETKFEIVTQYWVIDIVMLEMRTSTEYARACVLDSIT